MISLFCSAQLYCASPSIEILTYYNFLWRTDFFDFEDLLASVATCFKYAKDLFQHTFREVLYKTSLTTFCFLSGYRFALALAT